MLYTICRGTDDSARKTEETQENPGGQFHSVGRGMEAASRSVKPPRGGLRTPGPGKRLGRPPKAAAKALIEADSIGEVAQALQALRTEAVKLIEGMASPVKLEAVIEAIYQSAIGRNGLIEKHVMCPDCHKMFTVSVEVRFPGNVKSQQLWLERVAGRVPQTMVLRDPAKEGYVQLMREMRDALREPQLPPGGEGAIDASFRVMDSRPGEASLAQGDPSTPAEAGGNANT